MKRIFKVTSLLLIFSFVAALPGTALAAGYTRRMSVSSSGAEAIDSSSNGSFGASASADGRYVAFESWASNLVSNDTDERPDVFVHDRKTGLTERVSVGTNGEEFWNPLAEASEPSISADGRFVAFTATDDLVAEDDNGFTDILVRDRRKGTTVQISFDSFGNQTIANSSNPVISADGKYVAFQSEANTLVSGDTNQSTDIFIHDLKAHKTRIVSLADGVNQDKEVRTATSSPGDAVNPSISADGRYVAFASSRPYLTNIETLNEAPDVYVRDLKTHKTEWISVGVGGAKPVGESNHPTISADGRYVAFASDATNLVTGDTNGVRDVFVRDRKTGVTELISKSTDGTPITGDATEEADYPTISADGRFVTFESASDDLLPPGADTNGVKDIFVHDRVTGATVLASTLEDGSPVTESQDSTGAFISADGSTVVFDSAATSLVSDDTNGVRDVFAVTNPAIAPTLTAPVNFSTIKGGNDTVKLAWKLKPALKGNQISGVQVQLATNSGFALGDIVKDATSKKNFLLVKGLLPGTVYVWRARVLYKGGYPGSWAPIDGSLQSFDTSLMKSPKLLNPRNGSEETKKAIKLSWAKPGKVPKGTVYTLQYGSDANFGVGRYIEVTLIRGTRYTITGMAVNDPPQEVYWRMKATSADGSKDYSDFSATRMFKR